VLDIFFLTDTAERFFSWLKYRDVSYYININAVPSTSISTPLSYRSTSYPESGYASLGLQQGKLGSSTSLHSYSSTSSASVLLCLVYHSHHSKMDISPFHSIGH
jgi:hypothetical protein